MRQLFTLWLLISSLIHADELSFHDSTSTTAMRTHAIQLSSNKSLDNALKSIAKIPEKYRDGIAVYQIGDYFAVRYINIFSPSSLPALINDFKKAGFTAPLTFKYNPSRIPINKPSLSSPPKPLNLETAGSTLNQSDKTHLIINAQKAYASRNYLEATIYYEMMVASGIEDRQILLNLCYLYGREGSLAQMEKLIEGKRGITEYFYAYGVGSIEAGRTDLYEALSPQLIFDKSGKLALLCGYFYENQKNSSKAAVFYKMAYDASPDNPYILYAYARNVDINGDKNQALYLYTQLSQIGANIESLRSISQSRIQEIRRTQ